MVENIFNLDAFGALDQVEYEVHAPGKEDVKLGLTLILAGVSHPDYQKFAEVEFRRLQAELEKVEKAKADGKELPKEDKSVDEMRREQLKHVAARILGAKTKIQFKGQVVDLTPKNAMDVLSDPHFVWMVPQLDKFLTDQENFMPVFAANS